MVQFTRCQEGLDWALFRDDLAFLLQMRNSYIRTRSGIKPSGGRLVVLAVEVAQTPEQVERASAEVRSIIATKLRKRNVPTPENFETLSSQELLAQYGGEASVAARAKLHAINLHPCLVPTPDSIPRAIRDRDSMKLCLVGRLVRQKRTEYQNLPISQQGTTGKMLIMSQNIPPLEFLHQGLPKSTGINGVFLLSSQHTQSSTARQETLDIFEERGDFSILLSTVGVGSVGFDIMSATTIVLLEPAWDHTWAEQAFFRSFRHGQEKLVECYVLVSGAFEKRMMQYSTRKRVGERIVVDNSDSCVRYYADDLQKTKAVLKSIIHQHAEFDQMRADMWTRCGLAEEGAYKICEYDQLVREVLSARPRLEELIPEENRWSEDFIPERVNMDVDEEEEVGEGDQNGGFIHFG